MFRRILFVLPLLALMGCGNSGPSTGTVTGKVLYKNEPVSGGMVSLLLPATGIGANAPIGPGGEFTITDPIPEGTYQVGVTSPPPVFSDDPAARPTIKPARIPRKAYSESTSGVTVIVEKGKNEVIIELKD